MATPFNPQQAPILQPPQLPYEVFQAQAQAGVLPAITAINMLSDVLGEKLPSAVKEKRRLSRLAEVFKGIDDDPDLPKSAKESAKEAFMVGGQDAPNKVLDSILGMKSDKRKLDLMQDELAKKYGKDYYQARWGERAANIPEHIWLDLMQPRSGEEMQAYIGTLSQAVKPYGITIKGMGLANKAPWWSNRLFGPTDKFVPDIEMTDPSAGQPLPKNESGSISMSTSTGETDAFTELMNAFK